MTTVPIEQRPPNLHLDGNLAYLSYNTLRSASFSPGFFFENTAMQILLLCNSLRSVAMLAILISSSVVDAQVVNIDISRAVSSPQVGIAAAPDTAGENAIWNNSQGTLSNALDSAGTKTGLGIDIDLQAVFNRTNPLHPFDQEVSADYRRLQVDYLYYNAELFEGDFRTGLISGLVPGSSYDLYIYGQGDEQSPTRPRGGGQNVGIRIGTDVRHTSWDGVTGGDGVLLEDVEYVVFRGISADSAGEISLEYFNPGLGVHGIDSSYFDSDTGSPDLDGINSVYAMINGIQIVGDFPALLIGDVNLDGVVDFLDISPFIALLSAGNFQAQADCDENGEVNFLDISPFIAILSGS